MLVTTIYFLLDRSFHYSDGWWLCRTLLWDVIFFVLALRTARYLGEASQKRAS